MTDIDKLEGRELDAAVAEARGWKLVNYETRELVTSDEEKEDAAYNDGWCWEGQAGDKEAWQWNPSVDIAAAWELVGEMIGDDRQVEVSGDWNGLWECSIHANDLYATLLFSHTADTAPTAICRAYLKAKGV